MKCFNIFIFLLIFSTSLSAGTYTLLGQSNSKVGIGDIIELKVSNKDSIFSYLKEYENKRISELLYILEVYQEKDEIYFKAIIAEKSKDEKVEIKDVFKVQDVNFKYEKIKLDKNFKTIDEGIELKRSKVYLIIILLSVILILLIVIRKLLIKNKKNKERSKLRAEINLNSNKLSREHFEKVFKLKEQVSKLYSYDKKAFDLFLSKLDTIQYKRSWSGDDFESVALAYKEFVKSSKESHGI